FPPSISPAVPAARLAAPGAPAQAAPSAAAPAPVASVQPGSPRAGVVAAELTKTRDALAGLEAPDSLSQVTLEPEPGREYTASPRDWSGHMIYSLMLDRFSRG